MLRSLVGSEMCIRDSSSCLQTNSCARSQSSSCLAGNYQLLYTTFGRKLWSITLFLHARYGAMKVLCTGLVECGGVLVENSKDQVRTADVFQLFIKKLRSPPPEAKKSNTQPLSLTLNLARCTKRKAPSSSHQPVCHSIWRYPTKRLRCQSNSRKTLSLIHI